MEVAFVEAFVEVASMEVFVKGASMEAVVKASTTFVEAFEEAFVEATSMEAFGEISVEACFYFLRGNLLFFSRGN